MQFRIVKPKLAETFPRVEEPMPEGPYRVRNMSMVMTGDGLTKNMDDQPRNF